MDVISYSESRARLKEIMDRVVEDHAPVIVHRQRGKDVVLVSLEDFNALNETLHLLSSPRNAERLNAAIADLDAGHGKPVDLDAL